MSSKVGSIRAASLSPDTGDGAWRRPALDPVPEAPAEATPAPETQSEEKGQEVALRRDLAEVHKRTMAALKSLRETTAAEAGARHASNDKRLAEIDTSLNRIEGVLRIEVGPQLRDIVDDCLDRREPGRRRIFGSVMKTATLLAVGAALGTFYGDDLLAGAATLIDQVRVAGLE